MSKVYSHRFIVFHAGAGGDFTCPDGYLGIVTYVLAFNASAVATETFNLVHVDSNATIAWGVLSQLLDAPGTFSAAMAMRFVFYEGESLHAFGDGDIDMAVSGYLLSLP